MFKIKRADGYPFETTAYATRELDIMQCKNQLQFLIFNTKSKEWDWVSAKDWMPADIPKTMTVYIDGKYFCETASNAIVTYQDGIEETINPIKHDYYEFTNVKKLIINGALVIGECHCQELVEK